MAPFRVLREKTGCFKARKCPLSDPLLSFDLYRQRQRALEIQISNISAPILGNPIYVADGTKWNAPSSKKPDYVKADAANIQRLARHVDLFLTLIPLDSSTFDAQSMFKKLSVDLSTEFLFGESLMAQTSGASTAERFPQCLDNSLMSWNKHRQAGSFSFRGVLDKTWFKEYRSLFSFVDAHVYRALKSATEMKTQLLTKPQRQNILLHELARKIRCPITLRFELINVFLPSRDTTAALLSNVFVQLARHPSYWTQLRQSALSLPLDLTDPSSLSFSTLNTLIPFKRVIQETLRTLGPAERDLHSVGHNTTLPSGGGPDGKAPVFVPKGTDVCSSTYHIHRDRDIWGDDADVFRPERWAEKLPKGSGSNTEGSKSDPFLRGLSICPAQQQVFIQVAYVLLRMVTEFEWVEDRDEGDEDGESKGMAIESGRGVRIALGPRGGKGEKTEEK